MPHSSHWRSPHVLPRPVDPASLSAPTDARERLLLSVAWRARGLAHALGHALRRVPGGRPAQDVLARVAHAMAVSDAFVAALGEAGRTDAELLVQARLAQEPLPLPESWAEACVVDALFASAGLQALGALAASTDPLIARAAAAAGGAPVTEAVGALADLAADVPNRDCLQLLVDRWLSLSIQAIGRPGADGDASLLRSGVKARAAATTAADFLAEARARLSAWGLVAQGGERMGLVLPEDLSPPGAERQEQDQT